jgi:hypothetical protein
MSVWILWAILAGQRQFTGFYQTQADCVRVATYMNMYEYKPGDPGTYEWTCARENASD